MPAACNKEEGKLAQRSGNGSRFSRRLLALSRGKRKAAKLKWLCCFVQSAETNGVHVSRDEVQTSIPKLLYSEELAHLEAGVDIHECACCFSETPFEKLVQCADGHLFCFKCLTKRVEESTFGSLPANGPIACMYMGGCEKSIPWSEIERSIEKGLLRKFEQRQGEDNITHAQIPGMWHCPACNFACVVDQDVVVFICPNEQCGKATCMKCEEPFHEGTCRKEKEKTAETQARKDVEEIMSNCLIRECVACKAKIVKKSGCNKIFCRCGAQMCHTCRQPIKGYGHFCQHAGYQSAKCKSCGLCKLWYKEDNPAMVKAVMKVAVERKAKEVPKILTHRIGPH